MMYLTQEWGGMNRPSQKTMSRVIILTQQNLSSKSFLWLPRSVWLFGLFATPTYCSVATGAVRVVTAQAKGLHQWPRLSAASQAIRCVPGFGSHQRDLIRCEWEETVTTDSGRFLLLGYVHGSVACILGRWGRHQYPLPMRLSSPIGISASLPLKEDYMDEFVVTFSC